MKKIVDFLNHLVANSCVFFVLFSVFRVFLRSLTEVRRGTFGVVPMRVCCSADVALGGGGFVHGETVFLCCEFEINKRNILKLVHVLFD